MSVQATTWVIAHSQQKGASLLVLLMIANHAHADGTGAYPSVATLATECRMSERQVRRIIEALETAGELAVDRDAGPRGVNVYSLPLMADPLPDKMSSQRTATGQDVRKPSGQNVRKKIALPDISDTATGHFDTSLPDIAMSYEPSVKPSVKPEGGTHAPAAQATPTPPEEPSAKPKARRKAPSTGWPGYEAIPDDWRLYAERERPDLDPEKVFDRMRRQSIAKGYTYANWYQAFQNWVKDTDAARNPHLLRSSPPAGQAKEVNATTSADQYRIKMPHVHWMTAQKRERTNGDDVLRLIGHVEKQTYMTPADLERLCEAGMPRVYEVAHGR